MLREAILWDASQWFWSVQLGFSVWTWNFWSELCMCAPCSNILVALLGLCLKSEPSLEPSQCETPHHNQAHKLLQLWSTNVDISGSEWTFVALTVNVWRTLINGDVVWAYSLDQWFWVTLLARTIVLIEIDHCWWSLIIVSQGWSLSLLISRSTLINADQCWSTFD